MASDNWRARELRRKTHPRARPIGGGRRRGVQRACMSNRTGPPFDCAPFGAAQGQRFGLRGCVHRGMVARAGKEKILVWGPKRGQVENPSQNCPQDSNLKLYTRGGASNFGKMRRAIQRQHGAEQVATGVCWGRIRSVLKELQDFRSGGGQETILEIIISDRASPDESNHPSSWSRFQAIKICSFTKVLRLC